MPRNLSAKEDDREVAFRWELPESYNDIELTGYQYRTRERGSAWSPDWTRIPDSEATTTSHTVTGLTNGTEYTFEVRGINSKGGGPAARVEATPLDVGIRIANHSVKEGESTTLRILPPGAPFDAGVEKMLTIVLAGRGGADRPRVATDYILRRGTTPFRHSNRAFDVPGLSGAQPHFTLPMPPSLDKLTLTLKTIEDEVAECREELFAYAWIHDATDAGNRSRIDTDPRRSDNIFIEDDDPHAKLESAQIDGATVTLTFDRAINQTEVARPGDPDHDPGYLPLLPRSYFTIWSRGSTAPAWGSSSGVARSVAWRSNGPGSDAGTDASSFVLSGRTVTLTFPEPIGQGENAWLAYQRSGIRAPLGKATEGRCRQAAPKFITALTNVTGTTGGPTPPTILIADSEGFERAEASVDFTVTLDRASNDTVTVDYGTSAGTATAAQDYTTTSGTVTFAPGDTAKTIAVPIIDDDVEDGGETFTVTLSNPTNATLRNRTATGTIHNNDDGLETPEDALTARFVNMPSEHAGPNERFTSELTFSEETPTSYKTLRDHPFSITGGHVRKAKRRQQGSNIGWQITVEPSGWGDIAISLPGGRACTTSGAICTADNRQLSNSPSATIQGPAALSVADANADENSDATLDFAVRLNRASTLTVTVDYATSNGTATAGSDYTATSGTLTFVPGDIAKTVSVPIVDDAHNEGEETLMLTLSNPSRAYLADGTATGTIENTDAMPKAWLARFGRTVSGQVLDAVEARLRASRAAGVSVRLAGQTIGLTAQPDAKSDAETEADKESQARLGVLSDWLRQETEDGERAGIQSRTLTAPEVLMGSSFALAAETDSGGSLAVWGRMAQSRFAGREAGLSLDGDVTTGLLGADYAQGPWTGGAVLSHSSGEGGYSGDAAGKVEASMTALTPWAGYKVTERLSVWGALGYGTGDLTLTPKNPRTQKDQPAQKTDIAMTLAAAGVRGTLLDGDGPKLDAVADARWVRTTSEKVAASAENGGNLAATQADVMRLRLGLEGDGARRRGCDRDAAPVVRGAP